MIPKILAIVGPTASGKSDLAITFAKQLGGEVICVDSRTVYRGMTIGTAKPIGQKEWSGGEVIWKIGDAALIVDGVRHWGIDLVDPNVEYSIADFKKYAEEKIEEILHRGNLPILVGGTALWMNAITQNLDLPEVPPDPTLRAELETQTAEALYQQLLKLDPGSEAFIDPFNKRRLIRALEVCIKTGKPFSELRRAGELKYDVTTIGIEIDRDELRRRIDARVDQMIAHGLIDEVRYLKDKFGCDVPAMSGIGYRQICFFLEGRANLEAAIADTKADTWQFAKRQLTWWKSRTDIHWVTGVLTPEYFLQLRDQLDRPSLS